jgi:hypothetical protein
MGDTVKSISQEFVNNVKKYIELDDILKDKREQIKKMNNEKKSCEEFILDYLQKIDEQTIDIQDGRLRKSVTKSFTPIKKDLIQQTLTSVFGDGSKAQTITEQIINSRKIVEKVALKRTRNRVSSQDN